MWSRLRGAVAGIAEQAGIDVQGLDDVSTAVADLAGPAADAAAAAVSEAGSGGIDAAASATDGVADVVDQGTTTLSAALDALKGDS